MKTANHTFRIRYGETDKMGFVYYGNYAEFFEVGRVELFRSLGISYKEMEDNGLLMPVLKLEVNYHISIKYDEEILLKTTLYKVEGLKVFFRYEIFNEQEKLCTTGETILIFINKNTHRPVKIPSEILDVFGENEFSNS